MDDEVGGNFELEFVWKTKFAWFSAVVFVRILKRGFGPKLSEFWTRVLDSK